MMKRERSFNNFAKLAAALCDTQMAVVTLVGNQGLSIQAVVGWGGADVPQSLSFCTYTLLEEQLMEIGDAESDPRFNHLPYVIGSPKICFYAGVAFVDKYGVPVGTLSVLDNRPRKLTERQKEALESLSEEVGNLHRLYKEEHIPIHSETKYGHLSSYPELFFADKGDAVLVLNQDLSIMAVYGQKIEVLGVNHNQLVGCKPSELRIFADNIVQIESQSSAFLASKSVTSREYLLKVEDHFRWHEIRFEYLLSENEGDRILCILNDIHASRASERLASDYREYLGLFFEYAEGFLCVHDLSGRIVTMNRSGASVLGFKVEDLIGTNLYRLLEDRGVGPEYRETLLATAKFDGSIRLCHPSGDYRDFLINALVPCPEEANPCVVVSSVDVSDVLAIQHKLEKEKGTLEGISKMAKLGGWEMNFLTQEITWCQLTKEIYEVDGDFQPKWKNYADFIKPGADRSKFEQALNLAVTKGEPWHLELLIITAKGKELWVNSIANVEFGEGECARIFGSIQDINERKLTSEALIKERKLLRTIIDNVPINIYAKNLDFQKTLVNKAELEYLGFIDEKEVLGKTDDELFPKETALLTREEDRLVLENGEKILDKDVVQIQKDGRKIYCLISKIPLVNERGQVEGMVGITNDITKRKEAELLLSEKTKRLDYVIKGTNAGSWEWNVQTDEAICNHRWSEIIGYEPKEILDAKTKFWKEVCHPEDYELSQKMLSDHFSGKSEFYQSEVRLRHKKGHWVWVLDRGKVASWTFDRQPLRMYGTCQDISEKKALERELKLNLDKFKRLFELIPVGVALNDVQTGAFLESNSALAKHTGYTIEELSHCLLGQLIDGNLEELTCVDSTSAPANLSYGPVEKIFVRRDGTRYPVLMNGTIFRDEEQRWVVLSAIQDISEQKLQQSQLEEAKNVAEKASVAKSEFLANMSHEIRTPLNGVIGFSELLMKTPLTDNQLQYMKTVYQSAHSLLDLINDILDFSKIEAGKMDLSIDRTDLYLLTTQVADITKYQAHSKGLELLVNVSPTIPRFLYIDDVRLRQILVNLLTNAIKFTPKGEVELKVAELEDLGGNQKLYRFSVKDTGIGIAKDKQHKIFEAFAQEDASTTRKFGGSGLGLAITNRLLGLMGSSLQLESRLGSGSLFYFDVKVRTEDGEQQDWSSISHIKHVLVVDDNAANRQLLFELLTEKGFTISQAENGFEAIQLLDKEPSVDMVLMDYRMPYLNGMETAEKIREASSLGREIPIILLSSSSEDQLDNERLESLNIRQKLIKPLKIEQLFEAFHKSVSGAISSMPISQPERFDDVLSGREYVILIAEDNPVNMKLNRAILSKISVKIKIVEAHNGLEAYEYVTQHVPDLVLMDVQMPIMNGYEAAKAIRNLESGATVPIIALTAGTVKGEKERCLDAGMNDYLSKPILQQILTEKLLKWMVRSDGLRKGDKIEASKPNKLRFDTEQLNRLFGNDYRSRNELMKLAKATLSESLYELEKAIANQDMGTIKGVSHRLKGSSASAGFLILMPMTDGMERLDAIVDSQKIIHLANEIKQEISAILVELEHH